MRPGVVGRTLRWRLASPAGVHPAARVVATAPSHRAPGLPRVERTVSGRAPTDDRVRRTPRWAQGRCARIRRGQKRDSLRSRQHNAETRLSKKLLVGLVTMTLATSALAGERYIEVWNPPEARRSAAKPPKPSAHKPKKSRLGAPATSRARRVAVVSKLRPATTERPGRTAFHDLPPQMTPEGNVLRVVGGQSRADVER